MKLLFFLFFMFFNPNLFFCMMIIFFLNFIFSAPMFNFSYLPEMDFLSMSLVFLSLWLLMLMMLASMNFKNKKMLIFLFTILLIFLCTSFFSSTMFFFYFSFEASLIPIFLIILGWGYQPERVAASLMMFFFTMTSSLPLLISLMMIFFSANLVNFSFLIFEPLGNTSSWMNLFLVLAFLVKFPMFFFHLWLPKAHVEAPVAGSMILAGVLLKLGGYGMFRLSYFLSMEQMIFFFMSTSVVGGSILSLLCCRLSDMKVVIAYSSVVHMSLIIMSLLSINLNGVFGIWWAMLAHGIVSSGMFAGLNLLYEKSHSRSMHINKGILTFSPWFSIFWFLILMMNFGGPFSLNLFSEIFLINNSLSISLFLVVPIFFLSFFSACYSMILFSSTQQGATQKLNFLFTNLSSREMILSWGHLWPVFFLLLNMTLL